MSKIFCFGNEFIKDDALGKEIADMLIKEGVDVVKCNYPDELIEWNGDLSEIVIVDVVKGINEVMIIEDLEMLKERTLNSAHDFDLGTFLLIMKEMGEIKKVKIIGLPINGDKERVFEKVKEILKTLPTSTQGSV